MKEYKCIEIQRDTELELNGYAKDGWRVICNSWKRKWFVLERDKRSKKQNGKM